MGIGHYFDFILTSYEHKSAKPDRLLFDLALTKAGVSTTTACYHIGDTLENDVAGAADAGWTALRINDKFDDDFPDWFDIDTEEGAAAGADRRLELMNWGRKDLESGREWVEIWGIDDVLELFGFPEDLEKPIATTYVRGYLDD